MHAFQGAGIVLRRPHCDNAPKIAESGTRMSMDFGGMQTPGIIMIVDLPAPEKSMPCCEPVDPAG